MRFKRLPFVRENRLEPNNSRLAIPFHKYYYLIDDQYI